MIYEYTLPGCGKSLTWRSLRVQESIDARAACKGLDDSVIGVRLLVARIVSYDGKEGAPSPKAWGEWDEIDLEFFGDEVAEKEGARRASLRKSKISPGDSMADLKRTLSDLQQLLVALGRAATATLEAASVSEASRDPLGSAQT